MLDDIVVVDLTRALAGPQATMMLADLGARVIKVEPPAGDESRGWGPPFVTGSDGAPVSSYFLACNRNKESVTADLKTDAGHDLLTDLVCRADVLIENFRPGVLDRLGFDDDTLRQLNPGLIVCSISGFGHDGPEGGRAGYDQIAQGEVGLMSLTGEPGGEPTKVGVSIGDLTAGMNAAFGIVAALYERTRTGRGRRIRTSLLASLVGLHAYQGTRWTVAREVPHAIGNDHPSITPYGLYPTADDPLQVAVGNQALWIPFAQLLDIDPADERFATNADRVTHRDELRTLIEARLVQEPCDTWLARFSAAGIPVGKVRTLDQVYEWDQTRSQGLVIPVEHPTLGTIELPGPALRFDDRAEAGDRPAHVAPPRLGEHNESVRAWLDTFGDDKEHDA
ncbi:CaiB/BaiF CoA transferase family protein [Flexivirga meconopsidis]|uniref:CaiB/BaiF CoA transferase family protein n=1 Tax=Flexivirga meconopsidis TaxID=2977121 RepID=UPI00223F5169|nr:CoA transferase [Flexivirga meconopsidis]